MEDRDPPYGFLGSRVLISGVHLLRRFDRDHLDPPIACGAGDAPDRTRAT